MSKHHEVGQGEFIASIAAEHGLADAAAIWNHPENKELKDVRKNPHILLAGDTVFIPDPEAKEEAASTEQRTTFQLAGAALELHVKVNDQGFQPFKGDVEFKAGAAPVPMKPKGDTFETPLDPKTKQAELQFPLSKTERARLPITVEPGRLDPIDTLPGQQQRLNNLGYFAGFVKTTATDPKKVDLQLQWAVEEFQCEHMKKEDVDGVLGKKTLAKLEEVYGT